MSFGKNFSFNPPSYSTPVKKMSSSSQISETTEALAQKLIEREKKISELEQTVKDLQDAFSNQRNQQPTIQSGNESQENVQQSLQSQLNASQANERSWTEAFKASSAATLLNVPITPVVLKGESMSSIEFKKLKRTLDGMFTIAGDSADEKTKLTIMKRHGGQALDRVLNFAEKSELESLIEPVPVYKNAMHRLEKHFKGLGDETTALQKFRSASQKEDEKATDFILRLHELGKECDIPEDLMKKEVVIQFRANAKEAEFRKLTNKTDAAGNKVSLNDLFRDASMMESFNELEKEKTSSGDSTKRVFKVRSEDGRDYRSRRRRSSSRDRGHSSYQNRSRSPQRPYRAQPYRSQGPFRPTSKCTRCGDYHHPNPECFARYKVCRICNRRGHIAKACLDEEKKKSQESRGAKSIKKISAEELSDDAKEELKEESEV